MPEPTKRGSNVITIALCFLVAVIEGFDIQAMGIAAPKLAPELHLGPDQMGWIFSIANVGLVIGAAFGGGIADRIGRKPILIAAVLTFGAMTLATTIAHNFETMFLIRVLTGIGFGAALPNIVAISADVSTPDRRAFTAAAIFCGFPIGGGVSAQLAQSLPPGSDWRTLFLIGGGVALFIALLLLAFLRETRAAAAEKSGMSPWRALFGEGRAAPTLLLWVAFFPTLLMLYLILNWLPTLVVAKGLDRSLAPQASQMFNYGGAVGAIIAGFIVDRLKSRWPLAVAYVALIGSLYLLSQASDLQSIVALSGAAGFCLLGANYALYGVAASYYPIEGRGAGAGASVAVGRVGSVAGPLLAGALLGAGASASDVIQIMAPAALVAGLAVLALTAFKVRAD